MLLCGSLPRDRVRFIVTSPFGSMYITSEGRFSDGERKREREKGGGYLIVHLIVFVTISLSLPSTHTHKHTHTHTHTHTSTYTHFGCVFLNQSLCLVKVTRWIVTFKREEKSREGKSKEEKRVSERAERVNDWESANVRRRRARGRGEVRERGRERIKQDA